MSLPLSEKERAMFAALRVPQFQIDILTPTQLYDQIGPTLVYREHRGPAFESFRRVTAACGSERCLRGSILADKLICLDEPRSNFKVLFRDIRFAVDTFDVQSLRSALFRLADAATGKSMSVYDVEAFMKPSHPRTSDLFQLLAESTPYEMSTEQRYLFEEIPGRIIQWAMIQPWVFGDA